nr:MAG TPA: hypothetical protein [Caudoviricetes sp.]
MNQRLKGCGTYGTLFLYECRIRYKKGYIHA